MRTCNHCGNTIPKNRLPHVIYCTASCRYKAASKRLGKAGRAEYNKKYRELASERAAKRKERESTEMVIRLEREAAAARALRELRPVTAYYGRMLHQDPFLGAEYNIY